MYSIYADDVCIYNDSFSLDNMKVIDPKLTLEDSSAGSLSMTLPPSNIGYDTIVRMVTDISVKKDGEEIWAGRVLSEKKDFWNNRVLLCEGELAFFNDSTQPPAEYHDKTVRGFLETLISIHNSKVAKNRQFTVGAVTVTDPNDSLYRYTNYEKTIECINDKLIKRLGGHLRVRKVNGVRYLDYLAEYPNTNGQTIEFGKNLLDFTRKWDLTEFATVIVPLGNRLDESPIEALDAYLTVESVNNGSMYVQSAEGVATYGWIEKVVNWDDVSTASALLSKAKEYLSDIQFDDMTIELSALDLHYLDIDYEAVKLLDEIRVISIPHGMDRYFPVTKLEIPLDQPENTQFTLGDDIKATLTSVNNATNAETLKKIEALPKASVILEEAKSNATALLNFATNGYITITQDDYGTNTLYVSNNRDYTKATKLWKWNLNGLGYSKDGGKTYGLAITMNGAIVADYITTGTLNADLIKTGKLMSNSNSKVYFDLNTGILSGSVLVDSYSYSNLRMEFGTTTIDNTAYKGLLIYDKNNNNSSSDVSNIGGIIRYKDSDTANNIGLYSTGSLILSSKGVNGTGSSFNLSENQVYINRKIGENESFIGDVTTVFYSDADKLSIDFYQTSSQYSYLRFQKDTVTLHQEYPPTTNSGSFVPGTNCSIQLSRGAINMLVDSTIIFKVTSSGATVKGITVTSDRAKKRDIIIDKAEVLNKIAKLNTYKYKLIDDNIQRYGFMADELPDEMLAEDKKAVDLYASVAVAVKAIQELNTTVKRLKNEIKELKAEMIKITSSEAKKDNA